MAPSDSFDPRTWQGEDPAPLTMTAAVREPTRETPPSAGSHKWWLGPLLSAAILAGGAVVAYETRPDPPANTVRSAAD